MTGHFISKVARVGPALPTEIMRIRAPVEPASSIPARYDEQSAGRVEAKREPTFFVLFDSS
jgi:hypothetical protein